MAFQNSKFVRVFFNRARMKIPPVRPASYYRSRLLFTAAPNEERNGGLGLRLTVGVANALVFPDERGRMGGPHGPHDSSSFFSFFQARLRVWKWIPVGMVLVFLPASP